MTKLCKCGRTIDAGWSNVAPYTCWPCGLPSLECTCPSLPAVAEVTQLDPRVTERRAEFVYNAARLAAIAARAPVIPVEWVDREPAFREQFLVVIARQCGPQRSVSPEELHSNWMQAYLAMGWVYGEQYDRKQRTHSDLVPYAQLGQLEKDKDAVFLALCEIARQYIYGEKP